MAGNTTVTGIANIDGEMNLSNHKMILTGADNPLVVVGSLVNAEGTVVYLGKNEQTIASIPYFQLSFIGTGTKKFLEGTLGFVGQDWIVDSPTLLQGVILELKYLVI